MSHVLLFAEIALVAFMLTFGGCICRTDSWSHFQAGEMFSTESASMASDSSAIVYASPRSGHGDVYRFTLLDGSDVRVTRDAAFESTPLYVPGSESIVFVRELDGHRHIFEIASDGFREKQITSDQFTYDLVGISPDGTWIQAFRGNASGGLGISGENVLIPRNSSNSNIIPVGYGASFTADSKKVVYSPVSAASEIWVRELSSGQQRMLRHGRQPRLSPDGKALLFLDAKAANSQDGQWLLAPLEGGKATNMGLAEAPIFSEDCEWIVFFSSNRQEIWKVRIDGTCRSQLDTPSGYKTWPRPCRGGFLVNIVGSDHVGDIWLLSSKDWKIKKIASMK